MLREFYVNLQRTAPLGNSQIVILQHFCCKWNEMLYITDVIKLVLLYIVSLARVHHRQEENYVSRTDTPHISQVIRHYFIKYLYQPFSNNIVNLVRYVVRHYRLHNHALLSPFAAQAVQIIYACKDDDDNHVVEFLEVVLLLPSHAVATPRRRRPFLHHKAPRRRLRCGGAVFGIILSSISRQLDTVCALEARVAAEFGFSSLTSSLQDIAVSCLLRDIVGLLSRPHRQLPTLLAEHLKELFPSDLASIQRLLHFVRSVKGGIERVAETLKTVFVQSGEQIFREFSARYAAASNRRKVNWEYVRALAHHFFGVSTVRLESEPHQQIIKDQFDGVPSFFQSLYFAMAAVTDRSLGPETTVASGIAECIDHIIRKEK